tara:strand:+ start:126 stop:320 length:195 start_codon:yes stop_codon:yes gene_type:complete
MAIDLLFRCSQEHDDFIQAEYHEPLNEVLITGECAGIIYNLILDKSTSIKFAKTLRTVINKIQD